MKLVPYDATIEVRDICMCLHVQRAARALARHFDVALRTVRMTNEQFSLLMSLNRPEPPSMGEIARLLGADRTTLTAALKPLLRDGLAEVLPDAGDRRMKRVALTREGHVRLGAAIPLWREAHRSMEDRADAGDLDAVRAAMTAFGRGVPAPDTAVGAEVAS